MKRAATTAPLTATRQKAQRKRHQLNGPPTSLVQYAVKLTKQEVTLLEDAIENELDETQPTTVARVLERLQGKLSGSRSTRKVNVAALREAAALVEQLAADLDGDGDSSIEVSALRMAADMLDAASYVESAGGCS